VSPPCPVLVTAANKSRLRQTSSDARLMQRMFRQEQIALFRWPCSGTGVLCSQHQAMHVRCSMWSAQRALTDLLHVQQSGHCRFDLQGAEPGKTCLVLLAFHASLSSCLSHYQTACNDVGLAVTLVDTPSNLTLHCAAMADRHFRACIVMQKVGCVYSAVHTHTPRPCHSKPPILHLGLRLLVETIGRDPLIMKQWKPADVVPCCMQSYGRSRASALHSPAKLQPPPACQSSEHWQEGLRSRNSYVLLGGYLQHSVIRLQATSKNQKAELWE
jgi:hypothetical protein